MQEPSSLSDFVDRTTHGSRLRVETDLGDGFVRLRVSEAERRQAKQDIRCVEDAVIELLRNARDAHAHSIFFACTRAGSQRRLVMIDDGDGVPAHLREAIFEPRVTSKLDSMTMDDWGVHGRGMALYSIKANAAYAHVAASVVGKGSSFSVAFDISDVPERRDQSTLPDLVKGKDGSWCVGPGPHNIFKTTAEFALSNRRSCTVYMGSPVEVSATLLSFARSSGGFSLDPLEETAPVKRLSRAKDAAEFAEIASDLGLEMSSRSAHRVLQGEIEPLPPFLETLDRRREGEPAGKAKSGKNPMRDHRGLKIAEEDMQDFSSALRVAWRELADRYFLESEVDPSFRISHDGLHVTFPLRRQL